MAKEKDQPAGSQPQPADAVKVEVKPADEPRSPTGVDPRTNRPVSESSPDYPQAGGPGSRGNMPGQSPAARTGIGFPNPGDANDPTNAGQTGDPGTGLPRRNVFQSGSGPGDNPKAAGALCVIDGDPLTLDDAVRMFEDAIGRFEQHDWFGALKIGGQFLCAVACCCEQHDPTQPAVMNAAAAGHDVEGCRERFAACEAKWQHVRGSVVAAAPHVGSNREHWQRTGAASGSPAPLAGAGPQHQEAGAVNLNPQTILAAIELISQGAALLKQIFGW